MRRNYALGTSKRAQSLPLIYTAPLLLLTSVQYIVDTQPLSWSRVSVSTAGVAPRSDSATACTLSQPHHSVLSAE